MKKKLSPIQDIPRVQKTKEQLVHEQKMAQKRKFIIEKFYPSLSEATISIDEAGQLLNATVSLIMEEAMRVLQEKKMKDIKGRIIKVLCPNDERLLQIEKLVDLFDNYTLFDARGNIEGMKAVLEQMKFDEMCSRKLESFTPNWDKMLHK